MLISYSSPLYVHLLAPAPASRWPVPLQSSSEGMEHWPLAVQPPTPHPAHGKQVKEDFKNPVSDNKSKSSGLAICTICTHPIEKEGGLAFPSILIQSINAVCFCLHNTHTHTQSLGLLLHTTWIELTLFLNSLGTYCGKM